MTFAKRPGLPDIRDFIFNVGYTFKYTLGDHCGGHKTCDSKQKSEYISAMGADLLYKRWMRAIQGYFGCFVASIIREFQFKAWQHNRRYWQRQGKRSGLG